MHDVVSTQQHIALARGKHGGQRALGQVHQIAHGRVHHDALVFFAQGGRREHAVANELGHKACSGSVVQRVGIVPLVQATFGYDANHITNGEGFHLVMRHKQGRGLCLFQNTAHFQSQALAQLHIQVRKRFVQQ